MIEFSDGDLFNCGADMIVNTVNCDGIMGGGLAAIFARKYPEILPPYIQACKDKSLVPGKVQVLETKSGEAVANFPTKNELRFPSKLEYVQQGLPELRRLAEERGVKVLAIPALGAGLGGLEWPPVKALIEEAFKDVAYKVIVFNPK